MFGESRRTCLAIYCLTVSQILVSCLLLMAIAIERYLAVSRPFKHHAYFTTTNAMLVIGGCWLYAFVVGSLPLYGWNAIDHAPSPSSHQGQGDDLASAQQQHLPLDLLSGNNSLDLDPPSNCIHLLLQQRSLVNMTRDLHLQTPPPPIQVAMATGANNNNIEPFQCRFHNVMRGSYVAFIYPSHFIPLWMLMTVLYARIYCRSRSQLPDPDSNNELRRSRGSHLNSCTFSVNGSGSSMAGGGGIAVGNGGQPRDFASQVRRRKSHGDCLEEMHRASMAVANSNLLNNNIVMTSSSHCVNKPHTNDDTESVSVAAGTVGGGGGEGRRRRHSIGVLASVERLHVAIVAGRQHAAAALASRHHLTRRKVENWHAARILALLVGFFVLSWSPLVLWYFTLFRAFTVEYAHNIEPLLPEWMYNVAVCMVFANSAANPFLYGLGNRSVRRACFQKFRCRRGPSSRAESTFLSGGGGGGGGAAGHPYSGGNIFSSSTHQLPVHGVSLLANGSSTRHGDYHSLKTKLSSSAKTASRGLYTPLRAIRNNTQ